ncbi:DUF4291 family protein [Streptomyces echinatus]|uniref:DUF4291 family protein n=1 Tax=Streptomyces echinatus TaxID=67293 RepID=UPI003813679A
MGVRGAGSVTEVEQGRVVRAAHTDSTVTVYQAYPSEIVEPALRAQAFVAPFKRERMTWVIKPLSQTPAHRSVLVRDMPVTPQTQPCRMPERHVGVSGSQVEASRQRGLNLTSYQTVSEPPTTFGRVSLQ